MLVPPEICVGGEVYKLFQVANIANITPFQNQLVTASFYNSTVQFEQTTLNSDVIMLYNICQLLELKSSKKITSAKSFAPKYNAAMLN